MGTDSYFSEKEGIAQSDNTDENLSPEFWAGVVAIINARVEDGSFAQSFPDNCMDDPLPFQTDRRALGDLFSAEHGDIGWPLRQGDVPKVHQALDAIEFFVRIVSQVTDRNPHVSSSHGHLHDHFSKFDREAGQKQLIDDTNRLLRRCGHPFEINSEGIASRLGPPTFRETLQVAIFSTGDVVLDDFLEIARSKYLSPDLQVRMEALEKLWDAWERLKSLLPGDKKTSTKALLDGVTAEPHLRETIEAEANELTRIGNEFMIRHSETGKTPITESEHIDYFFQRMFAFIWLVLRSHDWSGT